MRCSRVAAVTLAGALAASLEACHDDTGPQPASAVRLTALTDTSLTGTAGGAVKPAPAVRANDERGRPLAGVAIRFTVATGGGTVDGGTVTTGADGSARLGQWTLGPAAGTQALTAGAGSAAAVTFTAVASAGPVAQITAVSGDNQLAGVGQALQPLVVLAADAFGNPVAGVPIAFTVSAGAGSIDGAPVVTDATGKATATRWRLGAEAGVQQVTAASGAVQAQFRAFAAAPPGELEGKVAFISYADPYLDIAVVNADGSGFTRLSYPGLESEPAWSPDGTRIAFSSDAVADDVEAVRLGLMAADGTNVSWLTDGPLDVSPAWSPDGSAVALTSWQASNVPGVVPSVVSVRLAGGGMIPLVRGGVQPAWSPDGSKFAFVNMFAEGNLSIFTANADGSGLTRLTSGTSGMEAAHPAWSPDGSMIAFVYKNVPSGDTQYRVAVMTADGVFLKDLASAGPTTGGDVPGSIAWSPDGSGIAFSFFGCESPGEGCFQRSIKYVSLDGSRLVTLIPNAQSPSWRR